MNNTSNDSVIYYTLKNITILITFPFSINDGKDDLFIYQDTIDKLTKANKEDMLWHLDSESLYSIEVNEHLVLDGNGDFATLELIYNDKKINFNEEISIITFIDNYHIEFLDKENRIKKFNDTSKHTPPFELSQLVIKVVGDLKYFDMENYKDIEQYLV